MSGKLKISVITPSYNQGEFIGRTMESILGQQGDFELEHIVIDGGSTDSTREVLAEYQANDFERLKVVCEPDRGQSDAINKGMRLATGDIVCWINSDDLLLPGALERVSEEFASDEALHWLYGKVIIVDEHDREIRKFVTTYKNRRMRRFSFSRLLQENWLPQMGVFWRRELGERIGPLREELHYSMDYDLWLRFAKEAPGHFVDQTLAGFRWHGSSKTSQNFSAQMQESYQLARMHSDGKYSASLLLHRALALRTKAVYKLLRLWGR